MRSLTQHVRVANFSVKIIILSGIASLFFVVRAFAQLPPVQVVPGEYIVKMKSKALSKVHAKIQGKGRVTAAFVGANSFKINMNNQEDVQSLKSDPDIEYVEPNYVLNSIEPEVGQQNVSAQTAKYYDQTGSLVKATEAWGQSATYAGNNRPIVAIIDTGLDKNHYVFSSTSSLWINPGEVAGNGIDDDFNGYVDDVNGWNFVNNSGNFFDDNYHGTHVSGIVLGATQDILSATLEPAKIRLMPLKFLNASGSGTTTSAINAIYYAVNMGAKVINCSWGGPAYSRALHDALNYAYSHGVLVISAAGNYASNNDSAPLYPAAYDVPSNVAVSASTDSDRLATFSNYGSGTVLIASPGVFVFSTTPGGYFSSMSGTSMAAPFVAGTAALALREAPQLSGYQMAKSIERSVDYSSHLTGKVKTSGRLNSLSLIAETKAQSSATSYQPAYSPLYLSERSPNSTKEAAGAGGCGMISAIGSAGSAALGGPGGGFPGASGVIAILFSLPMLLWWSLRNRKQGVEARRHERFVLQNKIVVKSGDKELVGQMRTIAVGGASFDLGEALERGSSVSMKIAGPKGEEIEVEGRIVWSQENKSYGVQFQGVKDSIQSSLFDWTRKLVKSS